MVLNNFEEDIQYHFSVHGIKFSNNFCFRKVMLNHQTMYPRLPVFVSGANIYKEVVYISLIWIHKLEALWDCAGINKKFRQNEMMKKKGWGCNGLNSNAC